MPLMQPQMQQVVVLEDPVVIRAKQIAAYFGLSVRWRRDLTISVVEARNIPSTGKHDSDSYIKISLGYLKGQTKTAEKTLNPVWNAEFKFILNTQTEGQAVDIQCFHHKMITSDIFLGKIALLPATLPEMQMQDLWIPFEDKPDSKKKRETYGDLHLRLLKTVPVLDTFLFCIRQRSWSFGDFSITEPSGRKVFNVEGSWPNHFFFRDMFGREVITIKRQFFSLNAKYEFFQPGTKNILGTLSQRFMDFSNSYDIHVAGDSIRVMGDIWDHRFTCIRNSNGAMVANVTREYFSWTDTYAVEIAPTENVPMFLACVIALEHEDHRRRNQNY